MKKMIEIYTDGSSLGNPGPGGWGLVIINNNKSKIKNGKQTPEVIELGGYEKNTTNNRMELMSAISAMKYLMKNHNNSIVTINTDSTYVIGGVTSWVANWEKNNWKTANKSAVLNQDLWQELIQLVRLFKGQLSWQKVKGHAGVINNERADEIARNCSSLQKAHSF